MSHNIKAGVATGDAVQEIFKYAKAKSFALPAVNVIGSNTINAVLETAKDLNAPVIIQFSNGGAQFNAGKGLSNEGEKAAIAGGIAGAKHVHQMAEAYEVPVNVWGIAKDGLDYTEFKDSVINVLSSNFTVAELQSMINDY
ncbi:class II fructose-bisphosphate aldolase, partial [Flavicella sp.]|nr:class II fructose-bisphosphate aldolase [Flavicella sp.]